MTMKRIALLCFCLAMLAAGCRRQGLATPEERPDVDLEDASASAPENLTNSIGMKLKLIPAGEFLMGSPDADPGARDDEKPRHRVCITRPFYLGVYEVTQEEYTRVMGTNPSFFSATGPGKSKVARLNTARFPAEQVRWPDAVEFCRRLSELPEEKRHGRTYRLPTEAEWEYACRAGTTTAFHCGDSLSSSQANFNGLFPYGGARKGSFLARTSAVGSYPANAWGLHDMHGNVWEWCADYYDRDYYKHSPRDDPAGPATGSVRVIRGGEWYGDARDCRSAFRYADLPTGVFYVLGFRVAMTPGGAAPPIAREPPRTRPGPAEEGPAGAPGSAIVDEDWPCWRGPHRDGTWKGPKLPDKWPAAGLRRLWRQPIGGGYSGIAAAAGRVITLDFRKEPKEVERVLCFDAATGKPLWSHSYPVRYGKLSYGNGPRSTPTIHGRHVYALGAVGHLHCLDVATGKPIWSKDLVRDFRASVPIWGFSASPVLFEELLIVQAGAEPDSSLIALDQRTGQVVWRNLPDPAGYATPILIDCGGAWQLVCWTPSNVRGLNPRTGRLLWTIPFEVTYGSAIADPIYHDGLVFVSSYYAGAKAIRPGAESAEVVWKDSRNLRALMSAPLYRDGHVYLLDKRHGLTCFDLRTGKKRWDDGNRVTPKGRNPQATLVWVGDGDRALILNAEGDLILARLNRDGYRELSRTRIIGATWAHPAYAGDRVYARSDSEVVCVSLRQGVSE
jgi:formylglycine-generating enzyme required for sulfatase activity/outer membrane protein assembly factor BamB